MVGESPRLFQPGQASHSAAVAKPESIAQSAASWNSAAGEVPPQDPTGEDFHRDSWWVEDDCGADSATYTGEERSGYEDSYDYAAGSPAPSASITRVVSVPATDPAHAAPGHSDLGRDIRRLPPIDQVAPFTADRYTAGGPEDVTPIYPSSGI